MKLVRIHLYLQRPARRAELAEFEYFKNIFDAMSPDERQANDIHRPQDLMRESVKARNVVYYGSRDVPMFNQVFTAPVDIDTGKPGANEAYKRAFTPLMQKHLRPGHETFYIVGEFKVPGKKSGAKGRRTICAEFRTLTARTEIPIRHLRH